jgi:protein TonB
LSNRAGDGGLTGSLGASAAAHVAILALAFWFLRPGPPVILPPIYKVNIVAAPAGPRAIGEVTSAPAPKAPAPAPPKIRETPKTVPVVKKAAVPKPKRATPVEKPADKAPPKASETPKAGGGDKGDRGTDVATVQTAGIDFPYPGYLHNIVRQIALNFRVKNPNSPLSAVVSFLIHRDGSVTDVKFVTRSGVYSFDLEAQGAIERASTAFGPLPEGFRDDVLPVVFSFDPRFLQ